MKIKTLLLVSLFSYNLTFSQCNSRYINEIFSSVTKTTVNYSDQPQYQDIFHEMDIYTPDGDTEANRPAVILIHTGSFLPPVLNGQATGSKTDNALVEQCM